METKKVGAKEDVLAVAIRAAIEGGVAYRDAAGYWTHGANELRARGQWRAETGEVEELDEVVLPGTVYTDGLLRPTAGARRWRLWKPGTGAEFVTTPKGENSLAWTWAWELCQGLLWPEPESA